MYSFISKDLNFFKNIVIYLRNEALQNFKNLPLNIDLLHNIDK